ncbi:shikimate kinase [Suicoccus acidiformans]|nr:shikimate kinase [Suicoccus acidiformans]
MKNIVLIGLPGSGKSTLGKLLADELNCTYYDMDCVIEDNLNQSIISIFKDKGEAYFREIEYNVADKITKHNQASVIATGGGVVTMQKTMVVLKENGYTIFLNRPLNKIYADIETKNRPLLRDNIFRLESLYNQRIHLYREYADYIIDNNGEINNCLDKLIEVSNKILLANT